jgi:hypothetical protein
MAPDVEAVSKMETEADDCRRLAAKFKRKAECARLSANIEFFSASNGATFCWHKCLKRRQKSYAPNKVLNMTYQAIDRVFYLLALSAALSIGLGV